MIADNLVVAGLSEQQAEAYVLLIENGKQTPTHAATRLGLTRTNAYKVLDRLVELGLAEKKDENKKLVYFPCNPTSLSSLVAEQRNLAARREEAVRAVLGDLLSKYNEQNEQPAVTVVTGRENVVSAYRAQISQLQPIYFLRSRSDIAALGFDTMHDIRITPSRHGVKRYGITPDMATGTTPTSGDKRSNLERTWVRQQDYDAPVEWSVSGSSLLIVFFGAEPHAVTITNPAIADAFTQLWHLVNTCLKAMPYYKDLPR